MGGYPVVNSVDGWKWSDREGQFVPPGENYTLFSHQIVAEEVIDVYCLGLLAYVGKREEIQGPVWEPLEGEVPF